MAQTQQTQTDAPFISTLSNISYDDNVQMRVSLSLAIDANAQKLKENPSRDSLRNRNRALAKLYLSLREDADTLILSKYE